MSGGVYRGMFTIRPWAGLLGAVLGSAVCALAANPLDVSFRIRLLKSPPVYHIGEPVQVELRFSSEAPEKYVITTTSMQRPFTRGFDWLRIEPATGVKDARTGLGQGGAGSILSTSGLLKSEPNVVELVLNQWVRFVKPGQYRLRIESSRVLLAEEYPDVTGKGGLPLESNEVRFTMRPSDPAWAGAELAEIVHVLDSDAEDGANKTAGQRLRFLNTPKAATELARRWEPGPWTALSRELYVGLMESTQFEQLLGVLEARLRDPRSVACSAILNVLVRVAIRAEFPNGLPKYGPGDPASEKARREASKQWSKRRGELTEEYTEMLAASLERRNGPSRASAIYAIWETTEQDTLRSGSAPTVTLLRLRAEVAALADD